MIKAVFFDAFGTLFNLDDSYLEDLYEFDLIPLLTYAREKQLNYTWLQTLMGTFKNFEEITQIVLMDACRKFDAPAAVINDLIRIYYNSVAFEDVMPMLKSIKELDIKTGICSNGTRTMLYAGIENNSLEPFIDVVYSVSEIRKYKPDPAVYNLISQGENCRPEDILYVSSNQWDVAGAFEAGFESVWLNRDQSFSESIFENPSIRKISGITEIIPIISNSLVSV